MNISSRWEHEHGIFVIIWCCNHVVLLRLHSPGRGVDTWTWESTTFIAKYRKNNLMLSLQIHKIISFTPELLKIVVTAELPQPIRQAGSYQIQYRWLLDSQSSGKNAIRLHSSSGLNAIRLHSWVGLTYDIKCPHVCTAAVYLKNELQRYWPAPTEDDIQAGEVEFSIHEQDKGLIRSQIIEAMVQSPEVIRWVPQVAVPCLHVEKH